MFLQSSGPHLVRRLTRFFVKTNKERTVIELTRAFDTLGFFVEEKFPRIGKCFLEVIILTPVKVEDKECNSFLLELLTGY